MRKKSTLAFLNLFFVLLTSLFIKAGCSKDNEDVQHIDEASLKATWRVQAFRYGQDSTNAGAWHQVNYDKIDYIYDLYCVYDSRFNQSFVSKINCAYDVSEGSGIAVPSSDCARSVFRQDTTWYQHIKQDISLTSSHEFKWLDVFRWSKHINLISQPCSSLTYTPEKDVTTESTGTWTFDGANGIITVDYAPNYSHMNGEQINHFRITSYTGNTLSIKLIGANGDELKMQRL